jgi:hypothetical protein
MSPTGTTADQSAGSRRPLAAGRCANKPLRPRPYSLYGRAKLSQVAKSAGAAPLAASIVRPSCPRQPRAQTSRSWIGQAVELHDERRV